jgi:hypothetical protein
MLFASTAAILAVIIFGAMLAFGKVADPREDGPAAAVTSIVPTSITAIATSPPSPPTTEKPSQSLPAPPIEPDARYALPICYGKKQSRSIEPEPEGMDLECRKHWYDGLIWTTWTGTRADASGYEHLSNCDPSCANGAIFENPVELHFSAPEPPSPDSECPTNLEYYTRLIVAYPSGTAPPSESMIFARGSVTKYNGMAAIQWSDLKPFCGQLGPLDK